MTYKEAISYKFWLIEMMFRSETVWFKMKSGDSSIWYKHRTLHPTLVSLDLSEHTQTDTAVLFTSTVKWLSHISEFLPSQAVSVSCTIRACSYSCCWLNPHKHSPRRPYVCRYRGRSALIADIVRYSHIYEFCKGFNHIGVNVCFTGIAYLFIVFTQSFSWY